MEKCSPYHCDGHCNKVERSVKRKPVFYSDDSKYIILLFFERCPVPGL